MDNTKTFELTILNKVNDGKTDLKEVEALLSTFKILITKHEFDGVKKLAYPIRGEEIAGYEYYEFQVDKKIAENTKLLANIDEGLTKLDSVLRFLLVTVVKK